MASPCASCDARDHATREAPPGPCVPAPAAGSEAKRGDRATDRKRYRGPQKAGGTPCRGTSVERRGIHPLPRGGPEPDQVVGTQRVQRPPHALHALCGSSRSCSLLACKESKGGFTRVRGL